VSVASQAAAFAACRDTETLLRSAIDNSTKVKVPDSSVCDIPQVMRDLMRDKIPSEGVLRFDTRTNCVDGVCNYPRIYLELPQGSKEVVSEFLEVIRNNLYDGCIYQWDHFADRRGFIDVTHFFELGTKKETIEKVKAALAPYEGKKITFTVEDLLFVGGGSVSTYELEVISSEFDEIRRSCGLAPTHYTIYVGMRRND
jgi:hypothetical protein